MTKPRKTAKKRKATRRRYVPAPGSTSDVGLIANPKEPIKERVRTCISLLQIDPDTAIPLLQGFIADGGVPTVLRARAVVSLNRYRSRSAKRTKREIGLAIAVSDGVDLTVMKPTMRILMNEDLYGQWCELHWNDPEELADRAKYEARYKRAMELRNKMHADMAAESPKEPSDD